MSELDEAPGTSAGDVGGLEYRIVEPDAGAPASRPTLVLLHEGLGSATMWKEFPDLLASRTGHRVVAYSRPGYGRSPRRRTPPGPDFLHREALDVLPALLAHLGIREPVLIGHSDGASIAIIHAGRGHSVRGLVLMAPHVFVEPITIESIAAARGSFETSDLSDRLGRYHDRPESMFLEWTDVWLSEAFRSWDIGLLVPSILAPMLLIQNEDDPYGTRAHLDAIEGLATAPVTSLLLTGTGHAPHVHNEEETLRAIEGFLRDVVPRARPSGGGAGRASDR